MAYRALLIGINEYSSQHYRNLDNVLNDIGSMHYVLFNSQCQYDITVIKGKNATHDNIFKNLKYFFDCDEGDTIFLYWAGHGVTGRLITYNTITSDTENTSVSMSDVADMIEQSKAIAAITIIDACNSGSIARNATGTMLNIKGDGKVIMTSSDYYQESFEEHGHGVFTRHFLNGLMGAAASTDGEITANRLHDYVCKMCAAKQTPVFKGTMAGSIILNKVMNNNAPNAVYSDLNTGTLESRSNHINFGASLDFPSLSKFIMTNEKIKEYDKLRCKQPNTTMETYCDALVYMLLRRLHWVGILTLEDLIYKTDEYYDFILYFTEKIASLYESKKGTFSVIPGSLLYHVCYSVIFREQSINKIIEFIGLDGYKTTYKDNVMAADYLQIYNDYYSTDKKTIKEASSKIGEHPSYHMDVIKDHTWSWKYSYDKRFNRIITNLYPHCLLCETKIKPHKNSDYICPRCDYVELEIDCDINNLESDVKVIIEDNIRRGINSKGEPI